MLLIRRVLVPDIEGWVRKDVVIEKGILEAVVDPGSAWAPGDARSIHGEGKFLIPAPIDPHVHVREPGYDYKEDWESCTRAALRGGFSTIFDMPNNQVPVTDYATLSQKKRIALAKSYTDFGLYIALTEDNIGIVKDDTIQESVCGIKVYYARTTGDITVSSEKVLFEVFNQCMPVLVHTGGTEGLKKILYIYDRASRRFAHVPVLYICHVSTAEEVRIIRQWKKKLDTIVAEVSPHHLFLNAQTYGGYGGVLPPLAGREDIDALWKGIGDGTIDIMGTDHAPHRVEEKTRDNPPAGFPGLETALPLLFSACMEGRLDLRSFIRLTSINVQELFSMGAGRGIRAGERADCVLVEEKEYSIGEDGYTSKCAWSPFHGWRLNWKPVMTIRNGNIAYENGKFYKYPVRCICG